MTNTTRERIGWALIVSAVIGLIVYGVWRA